MRCSRFESVTHLLAHAQEKEFLLVALKETAIFRTGEETAVGRKFEVTVWNDSLWDTAVFLLIEIFFRSNELLCSLISESYKSTADDKSI